MCVMTYAHRLRARHPAATANEDLPNSGRALRAVTAGPPRGTPPVPATAYHPHGTAPHRVLAAAAALPAADRRARRLRLRLQAEDDGDAKAAPAAGGKKIAGSTP